jgi:mono/diheme cytochrome c family protein
LVLWAAPSINDVFYRYDRAEVIYWLVYGRGNSPMPAWGTAGGGPMTSQQLDDIANYLAKNQISQAEAAIKVQERIDSAVTNLAGAEAAMETAVITQRQLIADIQRAGDLVTIAADIAGRAREILDGASVGIDTDGDVVSDAAEAEINAITAEAKTFLLLPGLEDRSFDPANPQTGAIPDLESVQEFLEVLKGLAVSDAPIVTAVAAKVEAALATEGDDGDGDGIADAAEAQLSAFVDEAQAAVLPKGFVTTALDPADPQSQGDTPDKSTAATAVSNLETVALNARINTDNRDKLLSAAEATLEVLLEAQQAKRWEFDIESIAANTFDGDTGRAERVVGIYNGYCARCHTSGFSAGVPFAQPAGSGGFGPALWEGRPAVQFLSDEDLAAFLVVGAVANKPYGVNGFGSGRMPGFGKVLSEQDLLDLSSWLRAGNLTGKGDQ